MNILLAGMIPVPGMHLPRAGAEKTLRKNDTGQERARMSRRKTEPDYFFTIIKDA